MKTTTKIYNSIIYSEDMEFFETKRKKELESLFRGSISAISKTVGPELKEALSALDGIAFDLVFSAHQCGMAQGIELAMSLQKILDNPREIAETSDMYARPIHETEDSEIRAIGKYLESVKRKDGTHGQI